MCATKTETAGRQHQQIQSLTKEWSLPQKDLYPHLHQSLTLRACVGERNISQREEEKESDSYTKTISVDEKMEPRVEKSANTIIDEGYTTSRRKDSRSSFAISNAASTHGQKKLSSIFAKKSKGHEMRVKNSEV